jgi:NADPH2:quinone reductase
MRALRCLAWGPTDELVIEELPDPVPGPGELVVEVAAAGINFPDLLVVAGRYQDKTPPPFTPGNEASGRVAMVGAAVTGFAPGDRVMVTTRGGAFAERCVVDQEQAVLLPPDIDFERAAGFGVAYGTSYHALKQCARLKPGETLLVLGAAGGVGSAAVELGKALGATVVAAAGSDRKLDFARTAGADQTVNYSEVSLRDALRELTGDAGVDVVYDPVGGQQAMQALRSLAWHGRYLVVGFASGDIPSFPANIALLKEASIIGVWWGTWLRRHPDQHRENLEELMAWIVDGTVNPKISESYAFEDFKAAFRRIAGRQACGKVVLRIRN